MQFCHSRETQRQELRQLVTVPGLITDDSYDAPPQRSANRINSREGRHHPASRAAGEGQDGEGAPDVLTAPSSHSHTGGSV